MLPLEHPDGIQISFDDHRLVANAELLLPVTPEGQILRPYPCGVTPADVQAFLLLEPQPAAHPLTGEHFDGIVVAGEQPVGDLDDDARLLPGLPVGGIPTALAPVHHATGQRPLAFSLPYARWTKSPLINDN